MPHKGDGGQAKPIKGVVNNPKPTDMHQGIHGTVSRSKDVPNQKIPNVVSGPSKA